MREGYALHSITRTAAALVAAALLSGCAAFSPDGGMDVVGDVAKHELDKDVVAVRSPEDADAVRGAVGRLLGRTLSADVAVQVALLNNRGLQAAYNELALAEAEMVEGSLPPNPRISYSRIAGAAELEIERRIVGDILALATLPVRSEIAVVRFRQAQLRAALETLRLAADTRRAYYRAVAAQEQVGFLAQAQSAAETATQLAARLGETGAMNKLDQAREQSFYVEIATQLIAARQRVASEREALIRSLGLWGNEIEFKLPQMLPAVPKRPMSLPAVEIEAVRRRVDLQIARIEVDTLAKSYGLTSATRFINLLDVAGVSRTQREAGGTRGTGGGVEVEFQVPVFDLGEVRLRQAGESYAQAVNRLTEKAVNVRSEARDAYAAYRSTYDIAHRYRDQALPLRQTITEETLLRYGAMQIDVFTLLTEARQRLAVNIAAIEAQRDFWLAATNLGAAVAGGGVVAGGGAASNAAVSASGVTASE
jgi:outer membrane protein TolC